MADDQPGHDLPGYGSLAARFATAKERSKQEHKSKKAASGAEPVDDAAARQAVQFKASHVLVLLFLTWIW